MSPESTAAVINAAATVVLVAVTSRYVILTARMVAQMKLARRPGVFLDVVFNSAHDMTLLIGNTGPIAARNLAFRVDDTVPWSKQVRQKGLSELEFARLGIEYLAPGRTLRISCGWVDWQQVKSVGGGFAVVVTYRDDLGDELQQEVRVDLRNYAEVSPSSFEEPWDRLGARLTSAIRDQKLERRLREAFPRPVRRCPTCGELVLEGAKKCKHCLEPIPVERPQ